jgi:protease-4
VLGVLALVFVSLFVFALGSSAIGLFGGGASERSMRLTNRPYILHLKLEGVIMDGQKFLKSLKKYRKESSLKAIVVEIDSPGGVVGPSQEIYSELNRTRTEFKIPIVAVTPNLAASGAYYAAMGADRLVVAPGSMLGSIGVIMEFANLEKLYDWAKVSRYTINTGKYKDSGSEYRPMRDDERKLFQELIDEVWIQFKEAVAKGRNKSMEEVEPYADGRVMTGATAVKLGFADEVGTVDSAFETAAKLALLDKDSYDIFEVPKKRPGLIEILTGNEDEDSLNNISKVMSKVLKTELMNRPLFLMPGSW